ncbi:hypothetical protein RQP46_000098 [Phenoliferia psychrophenolica]
MRQIVGVKRMWGCGSYIDPFIQASVNYVSQTIGTTPVSFIHQSGRAISCRPGSHLIVLSDVDIEATPIGTDGPAFKGSLDYLVVLLRRDEYNSFEMSASVSFGPTPHLLLVMRAKSPLGMFGTAPQIEAQLLVMLLQSERASVVGVLTNGLEWMFFLACAITGNATSIHRSSSFLSSANGNQHDDELIAALLVECIRKPGTLPSVFTAGM